MRLENKTAIVTGAGSGIGRASALLFAAEGAAVVCADWHEGAAKATAEDIVDAGRRAVYIRTDVSDADDVEAMVGTAIERFGRLDVLLNNAGIEGDTAPVTDTTLESFDRVISINLRGVFLGMKYGIPALLETGGGSVVNMASIAGLVGFPGAGAYCASKGGIVQLTKAVALEFAGQNVRVNAIAPGVIWTPMVERATQGTGEGRRQMEAMEPVGHLGRPEDIANMALFLASDESAFCTGSVFTVDGGVTAA